MFSENQSVYIIYHSYLDNTDYYYDVKHIKKEFIWKLASNLKKGIRRALGLYNHLYRNSFAKQAGFNRPTFSDSLTRKPYPLNSLRDHQTPVSNSLNPYSPYRSLDRSYRVDLPNSNHTRMGTDVLPNKVSQNENISESSVIDLKTALRETISKLSQLL